MTIIKLSPVAKAVVAFIGGLVAFLIGLLTDGNFTQQDAGLLAVWVLQTVGVYKATNKPATAVVQTDAS